MNKDNHRREDNETACYRIMDGGTNPVFQEGVDSKDSHAGTSLPVEIMKALNESLVLYKSTHVRIVSCVPEECMVTSMEEQNCNH